MSRKLSNLTTKDLEDILAKWEDSEDGLDFSDDDDAVEPKYDLEADDDESSDEELEVSPDLQNELEPTDNLPTTSSNRQNIISAKDLCSVTASLSTLNEASPRLSNRVLRTKTTWKTKSLNLDDDQLRFHGSEMLPPEILCLDTPFEVFSHLFTDDIIDFIRDQTNLYSVQKDRNKPVNATSQEIR